ncbi:unnamed protein product [Protopolystoma xenopodis]|uniref:Uncharacterized protein n=1 Tax=Protopolystoma xenopodis TaxID=117903 RepID=A0A3S5BQA8_9PLAT|nr:unnamed protein product [Protopolystoma xenopodis]
MLAYLERESAPPTQIRLPLDHLTPNAERRTSKFDLSGNFPFGPLPVSEPAPSTTDSTNITDRRHSPTALGQLKTRDVTGGRNSDAPLTTAALPLVLAPSPPRSTLQSANAAFSNGGQTCSGPFTSGNRLTNARSDSVRLDKISSRGHDTNPLLDMLPLH